MAEMSRLCFGSEVSLNMFKNQNTWVQLYSINTRLRSEATAVLGLGEVIAQAARTPDIRSGGCPGGSPPSGRGLGVLPPDEILMLYIKMMHFGACLGQFDSVCCLPV